jgi:hypothetical protein
VERDQKELIERGKIQCENGIISNLRADKEKIIQRKYQDNQAEKARTSSKNNDLPETAAQPARGIPEPDTEKVAVEGAGDLSRRLTEALGPLGWCASKHPSLHVVSVPLGWINGGCDLEMDILPAIRAQSEQMARRNDEPRSWKVFEAKVIRARDERLSPLPEPKSIPIQHQQSRHSSVAEIAMRKAGGQA